MAFDGFSAEERAWLASQRLGRLATVSPDGVVGNAPVTYFVRADDTIDIGGMRMGETKKFKNVQQGRASRSWSTSSTRPRAGTRSTSRSAGRRKPWPTSNRRADGFSREVIKIHPDWVKSFNLPPA